MTVCDWWSNLHQINGPARHDYTVTIGSVGRARVLDSSHRGQGTVPSQNDRFQLKGHWERLLIINAHMAEVCVGFTPSRYRLWSGIWMDRKADQERSGEVTCTCYQIFRLPYLFQREQDKGKPPAGSAPSCRYHSSINSKYLGTYLGMHNRY